MRLKDLKGSKDFFIIEATYPGNVGAMEVFQFYRMATPGQKAKLNNLLAHEKYKEGWEFVQQVTGVRLHPMGKT